VALPAAGVAVQTGKSSATAYRQPSARALRGHARAASFVPVVLLSQHVIKPGLKVIPYCGDGVAAVEERNGILRLAAVIAQFVGGQRRQGLLRLANKDRDALAWFADELRAHRNTHGWTQADVRGLGAGRSNTPSEVRDGALCHACWGQSGRNSGQDDGISERRHLLFGVAYLDPDEC